MHSERKRKVDQAPTMDRPSKRARLSDATDAGETVEGTTERGLQFIEMMRGAKDKNGRPISTIFLTLPDRENSKEAKDGYYKSTLLPLALDTIEGKLKENAYRTMSEFEGDVKRMILNAKAFYNKASPQYADAERVRKTASNFMTRYNPAYRTGGYVAQATPIPDKILDAANANSSRTSEAPETPTRAQSPHQDATVPSPQSKRANGRKSETPEEEAATPDEKQTPATELRGRRSVSALKADDGGDDRDESGKLNFAGKTFQRAQEMIMEELIHYQDPDSGLAIYTPFANLPTRQLVDYYQVIKYPISLKAIQKKVKGIQGRTPATGKSLLPTWDAFEQDMSYIWNNAREYNEDGSDIYNLAGELEEHFYQLLDEAKAVVEGPSVKLKLSAPAKTSLKLRLGGAKASPSPRTKSETPGPGRDAPRAVSQAASVQSAADRKQQSVPPAAATPRADTVMRDAPSASVTNGSTRPGSSSGQQPTSAAASAADDSESESKAALPAAPVPPPPPPVDPIILNGYPRIDVNGRDIFRKVDEQGNPIATPILPETIFSTHPHIQLPRRTVIKMPADRHRREYQKMIYADARELIWHVRPSLPSFRTNHNSRIFVYVNGVPALEVDPILTAGQHTPRDPRNPWFEARLMPGMVNRIQVEAVQGPPNVRLVAPTPLDQMEWERCIFHINIPKQQGHGF